MSDDPITSLGQMLLFAGINHGTSMAIVKGVDYLAGLDEDDLKEMTRNLSPDYAQRFYAVAKASRKQAEKVTVQEVATDHQGK